MLVELSVQDLAVIKDIDLEFAPSFNVLTGETGAGKSVLISAIDLALGGRAFTDYIRTGADKSLIEAVFQIDQRAEKLLSEWGIESDSDQTLLITREIRRDKTNRALINGRRVTTTMLKKLRRFLVDIHSQNEDQLLLRSRHQLRMLDFFGGDQHLALYDEYSFCFEKMKEIESRLSSEVQDEREKKREMDLLRYELNEIDEAGLKPEEYRELSRRRKMLVNLETLTSSLGEALELIQGEDHKRQNIRDLLFRAVDLVKKSSSIDEEFVDLKDELQDISYRLEDAAFELRHRLEEIASEPGELDEVERRLDEIQSLRHKYGDTVEEILAYREQVKARLGVLEDHEKLQSDLEDELKKAQVEVEKLGEELSSGRQDAAQNLEEVVRGELADLGMEKTRFRVDIRPFDKPQAAGYEAVEFKIAPNPGEQLKPLAKIASGGELSRIMLALKSILAGVDGTPSLIFDEIDVGIGGRTGSAVAEKMVELADDHQVLCITHLPQIAAQADTHYLFLKKTTAERAELRVERLDREGRIRELARMLAGTEVENVTREHARALLESED